MPTKAVIYRRLGIITSEESSQVAEKMIRAVPKVTPILDEIFASLIKEGFPFDPYYYLNSSDDPDARKLMTIYSETAPSFRALLPLEAFCVAASVNPNSILDAIVKSIARVKALSAAVNLSVAQPEIVDVNIQAARDIENGYNDRRLFMQTSGLMPMPKGSKTVVNVQTTATASTQQVITAPAPEQTARKLSERFNAVRGALPPIEIQPLDEE